MGVTFLYAGAQHLTDPNYFDPAKPGYIGHLVSQYAVGSPIHDFLIGVVAPNAVSFGYMVAIGELLIGIAALVGFLFRPASLAGLLLNFTFFLSATWNAFPFYFGSDIVFVMCWLILLLTGPQPGLSIDGVIASRFNSLRWLLPRLTLPVATEPEQKQMPVVSQPTISVPETTKLYPKQVAEVNRAFDRIDQQFVSHEETRTILEFVRAFVLSLGVDRGDAAKILQGLENIIRRNAWEESQPR
jgi:thiosulfate dehydrogenase [quinone] large subunit